MEFKPWPKIPSFKNWLKENDISELSQPIFCSVKIHGTNAAIGIDGQKVWAQSRSQIITPVNDNHGFATWLKGHEEWLLERYRERGLVGDILIFGEFAGKGIQKGVGVSEMEKFFYIFPDKNFIGRLFVNSEKRFFEHLIVKAGLSTDESRLTTMKDKLDQLVQKIDSCCPFYETMTSKQGIGEGIVVYNQKNVPLFKVKGESHTIKNSSTPRVPIDPQLEIETQLQVKFGTAERLTQVYQSLTGGDGILDLQDIPRYIRAVIVDIESEEGELLPKSRKLIGNNCALFIKSKLV
jgi:hypothetical protein